MTARLHNHTMLIVRPHATLIVAVVVPPRLTRIIFPSAKPRTNRHLSLHNSKAISLRGFTSRLKIHLALIGRLQRNAAASVWVTQIHLTSWRNLEAWL